MRLSWDTFWLGPLRDSKLTRKTIGLSPLVLFVEDSSEAK